MNTMAGELLENTIWEMAELEQPQNDESWDRGAATLSHPNDADDEDSDDDDDEEFEDEDIEDEDEDDFDEEEDFDDEEDDLEEEDEWDDTNETDDFANSKPDSYGDSDDNF